MLHAEPGHDKHFGDGKEYGSQQHDNVTFRHSLTFQIKRMDNVNDGQPDAQLDDAPGEAERFKSYALNLACPDTRPHLGNNRHQHGHRQNRSDAYRLADYRSNGTEGNSRKLQDVFEARSYRKEKLLQ